MRAFNTFDNVRSCENIGQCTQHYTIPALLFVTFTFHLQYEQDVTPEKLIKFSCNTDV